jgi:hypothetical protein
MSASRRVGIVELEAALRGDRERLIDEADASG